jgi:hypothetical protein
MRKVKMRDGLQNIDGVVVNAGEGGKAFYHKHMAPKARSGKKRDRKQKKASRRRNRK